MHDLVESLHVSKSSISTASRMLIQAGIVERISIPGERRDYYRISDNAWLQSWERRSKSIREARGMVEKGLALLDGDAAERAKRLRDMRDFYLYLEDEFSAMMQRWNKLRQQKQA